MKACKKCQRIITENFPRWKKDNPEQRYLQCPHCHDLEEIGVKQSKLGEKSVKGGKNKNEK